MIVTPVPDAAHLLAALLPETGTLYIALALGGFAIGVFGHLAGSDRLVALGIALVFLGAFLLPLAVNLTESTPPEIERAR
jgi:hypothetical protein